MDTVVDLDVSTNSEPRALARADAKGERRSSAVISFDFFTARWSHNKAARDRTDIGARLLLGVMMLSTLMSPAACTYSGGELLYLLGVGRGKKIKAEFRLTDDPVLIFVDDSRERVNPPRAARYLFDDLAQELLKHDAAKKLIPPETIDQLRQTTPDFDRRSCREIGELAGAHQVLWVECLEFLADEQVMDVDSAAYFVVTVKVINVLERKRRTRVRLWPPNPDGRTATASMAGSEVAIAKTQTAIAKELTERLAKEIAKLFYDHRAGDFDRQP